ncbi:MAG: hypothetical protein J4N31_00250 [Chloroflexi bacterium]|nr:hypothetical protein [Chloroflexota bacterium]
MPTAQWHAELMSHSRPLAIDSKAPVVTSAGAVSVELMVGFLNAPAEERMNS